MRLGQAFRVFVCLCAVVCLLALAPPSLFAANVPPGFVQTELPPDVFLLTDFDWVPNGDLWILAKDGRIRMLPNGATQTILVATLPNVDTDGERGLLGIAVDPSYTANHRLYFFYTDAGPPARNKIIRAEVSGNSLINITTLLTGPDLVTNMHNSGTLRFGLDGYLYASMGDNALGSPAQDKGTLLGKILRIATDGSIPPDNPFVSDPNARHEVWAYGFRNPFRFNVQPGTGTLFIGDVGESTWEELDLGVKGANYGYPLTEGPQPPGVPGVTYPVFYYNHNGMGAAIIGGDHMVAGNFPPQYVGDYFYNEYNLRIIYRLRLDANNLPISNDPFVTGLPIVVVVRTGPDGALYYGSINFQKIYRLGYVGGTNSQPVAVATATPTSGLMPLSVQFDGTGSTDADQDPLTYAWNFGDGGTSSAPAPSHTYTTPGAYNAVLTVSDPSNASSQQTLRIVAGNRAPTATITAPANGSTFNAGDTINFSGSATDPEDGTLGPSSFSWTIVFHHNTHTHPYLGPITGITSGSFQTADAGESASDVSYEIILDASDSGGPLGSAGVLTSRKSVTIVPNLGTFGLRTAPRPNLALTLDSHPVTAPLDVTGVVGLKRDLGATSPQTPGDGHTYTFAGWSDGGAQSHTILTPSMNTDYTATFACNLITEVTGVAVARNTNGTITLSWTPPADLCLSGGPTAYRVYSSTLSRPASPPGLFPGDPSFSLLGTSAVPSLTFTPAPGARYYLVVGVGTNGADGPVGHYGK